MNKKIIFGVLVVCLLVFVAVFAFSQSSTNVRWEYTYSSSSSSSLNEMGSQGWEAVGDVNSRGFLMKRRLP